MLTENRTNENEPLAPPSGSKTPTDFVWLKKMNFWADFFKYLEKISTFISLALFIFAGPIGGIVGLAIGLICSTSRAAVLHRMENKTHGKSGGYGAIFFEGLKSFILGQFGLNTKKERELYEKISLEANASKNTKALEDLCNKDMHDVAFKKDVKADKNSLVQNTSLGKLSSLRKGMYFGLLIAFGIAIAFSALAKIDIGFKICALFVVAIFSIGSVIKKEANTIKQLYSKTPTPLAEAEKNITIGGKKYKIPEIIVDLVSPIFPMSHFTKDGSPLEKATNTVPDGIKSEETKSPEKIPTGNNLSVPPVPERDPINLGNVSDNSNISQSRVNDDVKNDLANLKKEVERLEEKMKTINKGNTIT